MTSRTRSTPTLARGSCMRSMPGQRCGSRRATRSRTATSSRLCQPQSTKTFFRYKILCGLRAVSILSTHYYKNETVSIKVSLYYSIRFFAYSAINEPVTHPYQKPTAPLRFCDTLKGCYVSAYPQTKGTHILMMVYPISELKIQKN